MLYLCVCAFVWLLGTELIEQQSKVESADCLPTLTVGDIEQQAELDPFVSHHKGYVMCTYISYYIIGAL